MLNEAQLDLAGKIALPLIRVALDRFILLLLLFAFKLAIAGLLWNEIGLDASHATFKSSLDSVVLGSLVEVEAEHFPKYTLQLLWYHRE